MRTPRSAGPLLLDSDHGLHEPWQLTDTPARVNGVLCILLLWSDTFKCLEYRLAERRAFYAAGSSAYLAATQKVVRACQAGGALADPRPGGSALVVWRVCDAGGGASRCAMLPLDCLLALLGHITSSVMFPCTPASLMPANTHDTGVFNKNLLVCSE